MVALLARWAPGTGRWCAVSCPAAACGLALSDRGFRGLTPRILSRRSSAIPAIGVTGPLTTLGQDLDGTVETPNNPEQAGWFWPGPSPGQVGSAVILGHVDSTEGPAVFYELRFLQAGDRVAVASADGVVAQFRVTRVTTYLNEQFPARQVYAASGGASALQLVTCGGEYDAANDGYQSNVVVYTTLVGTTPATTAPAA
jgi:sortase (surface protein transpeptidase)